MRSSFEPRSCSHAREPLVAFRRSFVPREIKATRCSGRRSNAIRSRSRRKNSWRSRARERVSRFESPKASKQSGLSTLPLGAPSRFDQSSRNEHFAPTIPGPERPWCSPISIWSRRWPTLQGLRVPTLDGAPWVPAPWCSSTRTRPDLLVTLTGMHRVTE